MKELFIVRHAKSSWDYPDLSDHERPLLEKGKKRTRKMIAFLQSKGVKPDLVLTSSALRARETAGYLAVGLGLTKEDIQIEPGLYAADAARIFDVFIDLSDQNNAVMLVGHNPALTNFVNLYLSPPIDWLPTSAVVALSFQTNHWDEIRKAPFEVKFVAFPKLMAD